MIYPSADKLENWGSKYALVTLAAKRAKQLKSGAPPLIDTESRNPLTVALEEIAAGKVTCDVPDVDLVAPSVVEPEVAQLLGIPGEYEEEPEPEVEAAEELPSGLEEVTSYVDEEEEEEPEEERDEWAVATEEDVTDNTHEDEAADEVEPPLPLDADEDAADADELDLTIKDSPDDDAEEDLETADPDADADLAGEEEHED